MALPHLASRGLSSLEIHLPETPPPQLLSSQSGESEWPRLLGLWRVLPGCGAKGDDQAWVSSPGASAQVVRGLPHAHWENQIVSHSIPIAHWLDSNKVTTGLCVLILHNHHLNLNL